MMKSFEDKCGQKLNLSELTIHWSIVGVVNVAEVLGRGLRLRAKRVADESGTIKRSSCAKIGK